jgi:hypothetical protein
MGSPKGDELIRRVLLEPLDAEQLRANRLVERGKRRKEERRQRLHVVGRARQEWPGTTQRPAFAAPTYTRFPQSESWV